MPIAAESLQGPSQQHSAGRVGDNGILNRVECVPVGENKAPRLPLSQAPGNVAVLIL